jgi:predicted O-methyltransferase YrrM
MQIEEEFQWLLGLYQALKPKSVVEIGSHYGGTLYFWIREAAPGALVVSIDTGTWNPQGRFDKWFEWTRNSGVVLLPLLGDSKDSIIIRQVKKVATPIDFLFIDGSHTEADCQADFDNYWPLIRKGGICAMHDIAPEHANQEAYGVHRVWERIKASGIRTEEMIMQRANCGTGVAFK